MDSPRWGEIKEVLLDALDQPSDKRAGWLEARCATRPDLYGEVSALLDAHQRAGAFMNTAAAAAAAPDDPGRPALAGRCIGPFRLGRHLGLGGMGTVYEAERVNGGYSQQVAIKIIDLPRDDPEALARFRIERQILATLHHPQIVSFIDGGVTDDGYAYLVMERVDGIRITEYCRDRHLPLADRVRLIEQICAALQHAHQHGVVHRDLKPANILVTADGVPKILDFGIAKLLGRETRDHTATGVLRPMTPDYASPEQLRGLPVTTAADIYALGVLLYEILTGQRPYDTSGLTLDRLLHLVLNDDPPRPSVALSRQPAAAPYAAAALRGDLDAIVRKAMHKDAAARYASAAEFAEDLARHRASRPVLAHEPSFGYLLLRAIRRHRTTSIASAVAVAALVGGFAVALWQMRVARIERDRADARFNDTRQIANALIFKVDDGLASIPGTTAVRKTIVAEALGYLERLSRDPAVDDELRMELALGYGRIAAVQGQPGDANLGDRAGAQDSYRRAIALLEPLATGPSPPAAAVLELVRVELDLAAVRNALGDRAGAVNTATGAIARAKALVASAPADPAPRTRLAGAYFQLATFVEPSEALPHWNEALVLYRGLLQEQPDNGTRQRNVALVEKYVGANYHLRRDLDQALTHYQRALALDQQRLAAAPTDRDALFDVAIDLSNVASIEQLRGRHADAAAGWERSLSLRQQLAASDADDQQAASRLVFAHNRLAQLYIMLARPKPALEHARRAVALGERFAIDVRGRVTFAWGLQSLARALALNDDNAAACATFRRSASMAAQIRRTTTAGAGGIGELENLEKQLAPELARCDRR